MLFIQVKFMPDFLFRQISPNFGQKLQTTQTNMEIYMENTSQCLLIVYETKNSKT
jgi:hypothetical protein